MTRTQAMSSLSAVLNTVVTGNTNFCCLCFNTEIMGLHDELTIGGTETDHNVVVTDVLQLLFGNELQEYLTIFENICEKCMQIVNNIHTFIQTKQYNATLLMQILNGLYNSIESTKDESKNNKSLFISLNLKDFTCKHTYDTEKLESTEAALKRLKTLNTPKPTEVLVKKSDPVLTKTKKKDTANIRTSEMLLDPNARQYKCKVCLKEYISLWNLRQHFFKIHAPQIYKCPKCPKKFGSPNLLDYHMGDHCKKKCRECGKTFKNKTTLRRHEKTHNMTVVCADCGRTYKNKMTFKKHIELNVCKQECRANPANAQFTCDYCNKRYTQKMSLRVHIQYVHGNYRAHICEWCGKTFWAKSRLKAHAVKHTREKNFTCSTCQGKFVTKESLLYHTRLHTGEKPYKCSECDCTFLSSSRRAYHMKTYHLMATEECEICHSKFTSRIYLDKHKKSHSQSQGKEIESGTKNLAKKDGNRSDESNVETNETRNVNEESALEETILHNIQMPGLINEHEFSENQSNNEGNFQEAYVFVAPDNRDEFIGEITEMYN